jgi:hypothetical protein
MNRTAWPTESRRQGGQWGLACREEVHLVPSFPTTMLSVTIEFWECDSRHVTYQSPPRLSRWAQIQGHIRLTLSETIRVEVTGYPHSPQVAMKSGGRVVIFYPPGGQCGCCFRQCPWPRLRSPWPSLPKSTCPVGYTCMCCRSMHPTRNRPNGCGT